MSTSVMEKFNRLRDQFEGQRALYREGGFWLVRINNIRIDHEGYHIDAGIECLSLPGLMPCHQMRSTIGAGFMTWFTRHSWHMGYGGWTLYFVQSIIEGAVLLNEQMPVTATFEERTREIENYFQNILTLLAN